MDSHEPQQPQQQQHPPHGMMMGPNSYHTNMANTSPMMNPNSAAIMQNNRFSFTSMVASKPVDSPYGDGSSTGLRPCGFNIEPAKKKRGRPRKYAPDGNIALGLAPTPIPSTAAHGDATGTPSSEPPAKRNRGRPPGSGKKQLDALGIWIFCGYLHKFLCIVRKTLILEFECCGQERRELALLHMLLLWMLVRYGADYTLYEQFLDSLDLLFKWFKINCIYTFSIKENIYI